MIISWWIQPSYLGVVVSFERVVGEKSRGKKCIRVFNLKEFGNFYKYLEEGKNMYIDGYNFFERTDPFHLSLKKRCLSYFLIESKEVLGSNRDKNCLSGKDCA